jgi:hypothetical protein
MVEVLHLPPGPEPKPLTAQRRSADLREHLLAFLCTNNVHGWQPELPPADSQFMQALQVWHELPGASITTFKREAQILKKVGDKQVKLGHVHQLMAAAFGYRTLAAAQHAAAHGYIRNKTYQPVEQE